MFLLPSFALLSTWGAQWLWQKKKLLLVLVVTLGIWNWWDFAYYYWYKYPELTRQWFGDLTPYSDYEAFGKIARQRNLQPYLDEQLTNGQGTSGSFFEAAYIGTNVPRIHLETAQLPDKSIVLTTRKEVPGLVELTDVSLRYYTVLTRW